MKGKTENHPGTDLKDHHQISIVKYLAGAIAMISIPVGYWREVGERTLDRSDPVGTVAVCYQGTTRL